MVPAIVKGVNMATAEGRNSKMPSQSMLSKSRGAKASRLSKPDSHDKPIAATAMGGRLIQKSHA
jgi:hypothetical protein